MATTFKVPLNNIRTTLQSSHTSGSGTLAVATGTGTLFGATYPYRVTVVTAASYGSAAESFTIFSVFGRTTDTLNGIVAIEGTSDATYAAGAFVEMRDTAGAFSDIHTAVNAIENNASSGAAHSVVLNEGTLFSGAATIGTAGRVLTDQGSGADPAFAAPVTNTYLTGALTAAVNLTTSNATIGTGLTVTLPGAGRYMIAASLKVSIAFTGTYQQYGLIGALIYDTTNSVAVLNGGSTELVFAQIQEASGSTTTTFTVTAPLGPVFYNVGGSTQIDIQASYGTNGTVGVVQIVNATSLISALRVQ